MQYDLSLFNIFLFDYAYYHYGFHLCLNGISLLCSLAKEIKSKS